MPFKHTGAPTPDIFGDAWTATFQDNLHSEGELLSTARSQGYSGIISYLSCKNKIQFAWCSIFDEKNIKTILETHI